VSFGWVGWCLGVCVCVCVYVCGVYVYVCMFVYVFCAFVGLGDKVHKMRGTYFKLIFWRFKRSFGRWTMSKKRRLYLYFTLFMLCIVIQLLQLKTTTCTLVPIFILQKLFHIFRIMKVHRQQVSCRMQSLWYMLHPSIYGTVLNHQCALHTGWSRYTDVEAVLCFREGGKQYEYCV
jgi:hypothetical protein